ncbi:UNVERIFIED_CONTAM: hypothetical protein FKN15_009456 [Acipenser sinensis]
MGSEKDSGSPHSSVSGAPNPKCRSSKRRRISFQNLFNGKSRSRSKQTQSQQQQQQPSTPLQDPLSTGGAGASLASLSDSGLLQTGEGVSDSGVQTGEGVSDSGVTLDSEAGERRGSGSSSGSGSALLECPLCLVRQPQDRVPEIMTCSHRSCLGCLRQYLRIEITESRVNISCPECAERLNPHDIRLILSDPALMGKYEEFMLRRYLAANPDCRWCPAPDCGLEVQADFLKESFYKDTVSLGTVSDNASTTAMAGSIISSYNPQDKECTNLEIQVDIETKPRRLRLASGGSVEELLQSHATELAEGPEDSSSRKGHGTDVTLAQSESIRSDLEASDTQSEGLPELPSEESADPPHA